MEFPVGATVTIVFLLFIFACLIWIAMSCMYLMKYASAIDELEEMTENYEKEKRKYERATKEFVKKMLC